MQKCKNKQLFVINLMNREQSLEGTKALQALIRCWSCRARAVTTAQGGCATSKLWLQRCWTPKAKATKDCLPSHLFHSFKLTEPTITPAATGPQVKVCVEPCHGFHQFNLMIRRWLGLLWVKQVTRIRTPPNSLTLTTIHNLTIYQN
jgi:hypothetical protein